MPASRVTVSIKLPANAQIVALPDGSREICIYQTPWKDIEGEYSYAYYSDNKEAAEAIEASLHFNTELDFPPKEEIGS
ncbi:MAG: hypothetical protein WCJ71_05775 [Candidatus Omnitrophota bacterium]